ncbi:hypothetical protein [Pectobacterium versatile]|uniref:hypothetical protein n=1 Tax=Pectobacterium versatile TaxID=2488639 RepID=UPI001B38E54E|nr:hypothetical protein [Pectobacterium versatile]MBQ4775612.1 hypothetical protein [Pectobacterium versatile]
MASNTHKPSPKKSDYFHNGKPVHRNSYCAFLDVLGFSERTRASYDNKTEDILLMEFHQILTESLTSFKEDTDDSMLYFKSFTDNVVLAHPEFSSEMESEFGLILDPIRKYQFKMALKGFFVRGGLAVGQLFMDENSVYGAALLEAYRLESKVAVNPIVVLCDSTMTLVNDHLKFYAKGVAPQLRDVLKGPDGRYFINYLMECIVDGMEKQYLDTESLILHKQQIEKALINYAPIPAVFSKFSWLAAYHNYFCDLISGYTEYDNTMKVSSELARVQFQTIQE